MSENYEIKHQYKFRKLINQDQINILKKTFIKTALKQTNNKIYILKKDRWT